jgi:hypothetical protein
LAPIVSVQLLLPFAATDLPPASDVFAPQLVDTLTLPPAAGRMVGLTEIEHVPVVVPGCVQLTVMLP